MWDHGAEDGTPALIPDVGDPLSDLIGFLTRLHFLGVEDLLILGVLGLATDQEEVLRRISQHIKGFAIPLFVTDVSGRQGLEVGDLLGGRWLHRTKAGLSQEAFLLLQV